MQSSHTTNTVPRMQIGSVCQLQENWRVSVFCPRAVPVPVRASQRRVDQLIYELLRCRQTSCQIELSVVPISADYLVDICIVVILKHTQAKIPCAAHCDFKSLIGCRTDGNPPFMICGTRLWFVFGLIDIWRRDESSWHGNKKNSDREFQGICKTRIIRELATPFSFLRRRRIGRTIHNIRLRKVCWKRLLLLLLSNKLLLFGNKSRSSLAL